MCPWSWFSFTLTSVQRCMIATVLWSVQHARFLPFFSFSLPSHENCRINKSFHSYLFICYRETKLMSSSVKPNSSKVWTFVVCQTSDQWPWLPITAQKDFSTKILVSSHRAEDDFNGTQGSACSVGKNRFTLDSVEAAEADGLSIVQGK